MWLKELVLHNGSVNMDELHHVLSPVFFEWLIRLLCLKHDPSLRNVQ